MKINFFGTTSTESFKTLKLPERICIHILSFIEPNNLDRLMLVSQTWKELIKKTKSHMALMPSIKRIPLLEPYDLGQLGIYPLSGGMTNCTFKIRLRKKNRWVLRVPGEGSTVFVDRKIEANNARQAANLHINVAIDFFDPHDGLQLTRYLNNNRTLEEELKTNPLILKAVAAVLKSLHNSTPFPNEVNLFRRNKELMAVLKNKHAKLLPMDVESVETVMEQIQTLTNNYTIPLSPCHNDVTASNFLVSENPETQEKWVKLLDFELSANNDRACDIAYLFWDADLSPQHTELFVESYFGQCNETVLSWLYLYKPVIGWWYTIWSWTQIANNANACAPEAYMELATRSYEKTKNYLKTEEFKTAFNFIESETQSASFTGLRHF
ncbi:phosphotransferase [Legionella clemsonensis]|uniref:Choline/ethanolamine kinase n=1 Tax=Legionella clemsonensis TaxID=1867846 RepID=A0A222P6M2_9GAMM|nr:phosphotransferase [Legionella clemsonensis]ASQ47425.1 Choline/ethanolamine kinase [Legionella clemsonensis]